MMCGACRGVKKQMQMPVKQLTSCYTCRARWQVYLSEWMVITESVSPGLADMSGSSLFCGDCQFYWLYLLFVLQIQVAVASQLTTL